MLIATGATAPHDPDIFRKATRRIGFLDRTSVFDTDADLLRRVERLYAEVVANQAPPAGPARDELLAMCRAGALSAS